MVRSAAELFQRQGYHATGINQILDAGQAPKGSLYFHFPGGKEQVAVEAVAASGATIRDQLRTALEIADDPATGVGGLVELLAARLVTSDFRAGCPVTGVALDSADTSDAIRAACDDVYRTWLAVLGAALARWGVPAGQVDDLATTLLATVEGALVFARVQRDTRPLRAVTGPIVTLITATIAVPVHIDPVGSDRQ